MRLKPTSLEWDYVSNEPVPCPVCGSNWPNAPSVYVSEEEGAALVGRTAFLVTPTQSRVLQALSSTYGRWVQPDDLLFIAYSDVPEVDIPQTVSPISTALHKLRGAIKRGGYIVEFRRGYGYRFIHQADRKRGKAENVNKRVRKQPNKQAEAKPATRRERKSTAGPKRRAAAGARNR